MLVNIGTVLRINGQHSTYDISFSTPFPLLKQRITGQLQEKRNQQKRILLIIQINTAS